MNIVPPTTIGAASCPRTTPVENVYASFSVATLAGEMSSSGEKRVLA
jgi:hypothetical protein